MAESGDLWAERMAVVATLAFIRKDRFKTALALAEGFLDHEHDLVHKAAGWMLREVGKRDPAVLHSFLRCARRADAAHDAPPCDREAARTRAPCLHARGTLTGCDGQSRAARLGPQVPGFPS
ncbi:MAG: hypothetical protein DYH08_04340 [Actinobacteria bacterium ATB1]|nr:hypothetical protein [Actinobacteria bacterium ATB1]